MQAFLVWLDAHIKITKSESGFSLDLIFISSFESYPLTLMPLQCLDNDLSLGALSMQRLTICHEEMCLPEPEICNSENPFGTTD